MIISEDSTVKTRVETSEVIKTTDSDPPPSYSPGDSHVASTSATSQDTPSLTIPPDLKPCNFTHVSLSNKSVKGSWVVDPGLVIPQLLLPPLAPGETAEKRKNLVLESTNGQIDAEVFVMSPKLDTMKERKHVAVHAHSTNGSVTIKLHATSSPSSPRLPLTVTGGSTNGAIAIHLPRTFHGPLRLKTINGSVKMSTAIKDNHTPFSEINRVHRSFLGHFDPSEFEEDGEWAGDNLQVETTNGSIKLFYDDEAVSVNGKQAGFFERLFGI